MKNTIDKIYLILLCIIIAMLNLFIGSNHQEPKTILETIILIIGLTYIVIKKLKNQKNIVIKGKIDIFILLLITATFIPLVIKNCYSVNDTINFCLEYLCVYAIYILARNILKTKKEINIVIDVTLISSIVIIIFGLDKLYFNIFNDFLVLIQSRLTNSYGMISTFGYSNPLAAYMSLMSFIALGRYFSVENKWVRALYSSYIQIALLGFVFGNSRALMLMYPIIFIIYLIVLKDKQKRLESIAIIGINFIIAYLFQAICGNLITTNLMLWLAFAMDLILVYFVSLIVNKITIKIKINKKKILITVAIVILLCTIYLLLVKDIGEPVVLDGEDIMTGVLGLKNNEDYDVKINLTASIQDNNLSEISEDQQFKIIVADASSQRTLEDEQEVTLQNGEQNLEFKIHAGQDFERILIYIKNYKNETDKVVINHIYINNKEYIAQYKYLPNDIIRLIRTLNFRSVSVYERVAFGIDSLKLAQNHLIFGAGGCAFENHIKPYQSYVHGYNRESHSYVLDLLLNYGIFGLLIYGSILIITIYNAYKTIKNSRKENKENNIAPYIAVLFGILLFTLHATVDYDLNYLVTLCIYYMFIAIINKDDKKLEQMERKEGKIKLVEIVDCVILIAIAGGLMLTVPRCFTNYWIKEEEYKKAYELCKYSADLKYKVMDQAYRKNDIDTLDEFLQLYVKDEKYKNNFYILDKYRYVTIANLKRGRIDTAIENLEAFYKYLTENDNVSKVNVNEIDRKNRIIALFLQEFEKCEDALTNEQVLNWYHKFKEL